MLRQVRGLGITHSPQGVHPTDPSQTDGTVLRIRVLPGAKVKADTVHSWR